MTWLALRSSLGPEQTTLFHAQIYIDDPMFVRAGSERMVRAAMLWQCVLNRFGVLLSSIEKKFAGVSVAWAGLLHHGLLGLMVIPARKSLRLLAASQEFLDGSITC